MTTAHPRLRETLARLTSRAGDTGVGEHERAACQAAVDRLRARHGDTVDALLAGLIQEPEGEAFLRWDHDWERELQASAGHFLGLSVFRTKGGTVRARWRHQVHVRGPRSLVSAWKHLVEAHHGVLADMLKGTLLGYLVGAMPIPPKPDADDDQPKPEPMSADMLRAARLAHEQGSSKRHAGGRVLHD